VLYAGVEGGRHLVTDQMMERVRSDLALLHAAHSSGKIFFPREKPDHVTGLHTDQHPEVQTILQYQRKAGRFF
jgi:hypothetical protein